MDMKCPGQDSRKMKAEVIRCKNCGYEVELFSDEIKRKCPECKMPVFREMMQSCIDWCACVEQCVGEENYRKYMQEKKLYNKQHG
jgi:hypothetical protein